MGIKHAYDSASSGEVENKPDAGLAVDPGRNHQGPEIRDDVGNPGGRPGGTQLEPEEGQERRFYVYYLRRPDKVDPLEPDKGQPFYVGKGGNCRYKIHRQEAKRLLHKSGRKQYKISIIHSLWKQSLNFEEDIAFNELTEPEALKIERQAIGTYGRKDNKTGILANLTNGGEGASGFIRSDETIEKIRQANLGKIPWIKGKTHTPETKEKLRQSHLGKKRKRESIEKGRLSNIGRKQTPESIEKTRLANIGRKYSLETIEKMRQAHLGKKASPEAIEKNRQARLGKKRNPDTIEKTRLANIGRKHTPEAIEKMKQAHLGKIPWNKGKKMPEEFCEKCTKSHEGKPWSKARREAENNRKKKD